jgi:uncharacterized metal-binding protein YceD (DUF177 family)
MTSTEPVPPLPWSVAVVDVPAGGKTWRADATSAEAKAVGDALSIRGVERLSATAFIEARAGGRYVVKGRAIAHVIQACVISLDDVPQVIDEPFEIEFRPAEQVTADSEMSFDADADVEPIVRARLDLGRIVYETIAAGLDPYPRAPGAGLESTSAAPSGSDLNPFAVLKGLKPR